VHQEYLDNRYGVVTTSACSRAKLSSLQLQMRCQPGQYNLFYHFGHRGEEMYHLPGLHDIVSRPLCLGYENNLSLVPIGNVIPEAIREQLFQELSVGACSQSDQSITNGIQAGAGVSRGAPGSRF